MAGERLAVVARWDVPAREQGWLLWESAGSQQSGGQRLMSSQPGTLPSPPLLFLAPQALANTLWSFANLRWYPVQLLEPITRAVGRKMHSMSTQEISNSIWSYAK